MNLCSNQIRPHSLCWNHFRFVSENSIPFLQRKETKLVWKKKKSDLCQDQWALSPRMEVKNYVNFLLWFNSGQWRVWHFLTYTWASDRHSGTGSPNLSLFFTVWWKPTLLLWKEKSISNRKNFLGINFISRLLQISAYFRMSLKHHISPSFMEEMRLVNEYSLIWNPNPPWEDRPDSCCL